MTLTDEQQEIKDEFVRVRGTWGEPWQRMLELDPAFVRAYLNFSSVPWRREPGALEPKVREFCSIAVDAAATHLYVPGLKLHMRNALGHGASTAEILEVIEIAGVIGIHAATTAAPIIAELAGRDAAP